MKKRLSNLFFCYIINQQSRKCLSGGIGRRTGLKILRALTLVSVQVRPQAPIVWRNTQVWLKGPVLKTGRSRKWRRGSNPFSSAKFISSRDGAARQLVGLITQRSLVQIHLPQPWSRGVVVITSACHAEDREFKSRRDRHFFWLCSSVGRARD